MTQRFHPLLEHLGLKEQFGFQRSMGTTDASFVVRQAINLRHEAGKDTWVLFVDLVKAFDSVPRDGVLKVLAKYGVPGKMLNWIKRIYEKVIVKVKIEDASDEFASCTGVKQGDNLSPTLFLFMMQAFMELLRNDEATGQKWPERMSFRTRKDGVMTGRPRERGGANSAKLREAERRHHSHSESKKDCYIDPETFEFELDASLYADDAALLFETREDLVAGTNIIYDLLVRLGLMMHVGRGDKASKTESMFIPGYGHEYESGDTSRYLVNGDGFIDFCKVFTYLGSKISCDGTDDADINHRIVQASKMFGCLRKTLCGKRIKIGTKYIMYNAYVLPILTFGSEFWRLTTKSLGKLESYHRKNVRAMAGLTTFQTWKERISAFELEEKCKATYGSTKIGDDGKVTMEEHFGPCLRSMRSYVAERALRWLGHVARMPSDKLPRRMLSAWVYQAKDSSARKRVAKQTTYGGTVARYHFKYVLMNPSVHPDVREALTREVEHRSIKTGKKISLATLKANKFYDRAPNNACDENWVHIAEHRDFWRECVVKAAKFHYNYRDPDEQVEYKIRPATPEKPSAEQQRANDWDEWLLTEQPLDEEATRKLARKDEAEKKEKAQREYDREQNRITKKRKQDAHARSTCTLLHLPTLTGQT